MPGLAALRAAPRDAIAVDYRKVDKGGELSYSTTDPTLVHALQAWLGAELSDHRAAPMEGHQHHTPAKR
jgi:hypothetical protein